jgi:hypothetical protein
VAAHRIPAEPRNAFESPLELGILERLHLPAVVAHEMVMVLTLAVRLLEPRDAVSEIHALHEAQVVEAFERAVHACDPDASPTGSKAVVDLLGGDAAVLFSEEADDRPPGASAPPRRVAKAKECVVGPGRSRH